MAEKDNKPEIRFAEFIDAWEQRKLEEVVDFLDEKRKPLKAETRVSGQYPYYGASGIIDYVKDYLFDEELILLSEDGANIIDRNYRVCFLASGKYWVNNHAHVLRSKENYINGFLCESLERLDYEKYNTGTAQPKLNQEVCRNINIMVPKTLEQNKIATFLGNFDKHITLHQRKYDKLVILKKSMLEKMFPKNGANVPEIRFAGFTDAWERCKLGELVREYSERTEIEDEDTLLSCSIEGMFLNSELFSHQRGASNIGYLKVKKGDLILSAQNLHLGNANVNLRFDHGIVSPAYKVYSIIGCLPEFLAVWVKKDDTKNFFLDATTAGASLCRKNVEWKTLYNQSLPIPKISEQKKIAKYFTHLDKLIILHKRKLEKLKNIKKSILKEMFV